MSLYELPNMSGGVDNAIISVASISPSITIGLLLFVYIVVLLSGTAQQRARTGYADYPMWALVSSMAIFLIATILSIKAGIIIGEVYGVVLAITILSALWFFLSKGRGEQ